MKQQYNKDGIKNNNGRLVFENREAFDKYIQWIFENQDNSEMIESKNELLDFQSMLKIYEVGMAKDQTSPEFKSYIKLYPNVFEAVEFDNSTIYELQAPNVIAYIANKDGVYQIGNTIYRMSLNCSYEITDGDESKLAIVVSANGDVNLENVNVNMTNTSEKGEYGYRTEYFDSNHRIVARLREFQPSNLWYYEARTTAQKKSWGIWVQENIAWVRVQWDAGYFYEMYSQVKIDIDAYVSPNDLDDIKRTFAITNSSYKIDFSRSFCKITHKGCRHMGNNNYVTKEIITPDAI